MPRSLLLAVLVLGLLASAAALYFLSEGRRLGDHVTYLEGRVHTLEGELAQALRHRDEVNRFLAEKVDEVQQEREAREQQARDAFRSMPEGVRLALVALNRCLGEDGYPEVRFLWAREIDGRSLLGVELLEHERKQLRSRIYLAGKVELLLQRERGELILRFTDGRVVTDGEPEEFPEDGQQVVFRDVNGPMWESRVGFLLNAEGEYPLPEARAKPGPALDRETRDAWMERFRRLLSDAGTDVTYRVNKFGSLRGGVFTDVLLLGYQGGKVLSMAIEAERMTVVGDEQLSTVELLLENGVLRKSGGETRIGERGYRILLPRVSKDQAMEIMLGMVVVH